MRSMAFTAGLASKANPAMRVQGRRIAAPRVSPVRATQISLRTAQQSLFVPSLSQRSLVIVDVKKSVGDLTTGELRGKKVFVRADLNVPLKDGTITDDTRIRAAVPTLKYLMDNGARVLVTSHLVSKFKKLCANIFLGFFHTFTV